MEAFCGWCKSEFERGAWYASCRYGALHYCFSPTETIGTCPYCNKEIKEEVE